MLTTTKGGKNMLDKFVHWYRQREEQKEQREIKRQKEVQWSIYFSNIK